MKTTFKLFFAALITLAAFSSQAQCGGPFSTRFESLGTVSFQDSSLYGVPSTWSFGDGTTVYDSNFTFQITHTYTVGGTYTVCVSVNDTPVCSYNYCDSVVINLCSGTSAFEYSQTGFGAYSFADDNNTSTSSLLWSFGDGGTSTARYPSHNYTASGNYTATLILNDSVSGCIDTTSQNINVSLCSFYNSYQYDSIGNNPSPFIVVDPVSGYTYTWHFGDGTSATGDTVSHQYNHYNTYNFCLLTSDAITGCTDSICGTTSYDPCGIYASVNQSVNGLLASFSVGFGPQSQGSSGLTYAWSFPGATPSTSSSAAVGITYSTMGTYTANVTVTNSSQCADTLSQSVSVNSSISLWSISGTASESGGGSCATIYLISQDTTGHLILLDSIASTDSAGLGCTGQYAFYNLPVDTYYVKAALNTSDPDYADYLPTYYGNVLHWADATPVVLSTSNETANIDLIEGSNPGGPGFVSGWIDHGAGIIVQPGAGNVTRSTGQHLAGIQVNLLTENNTPVAYTYSDTSGQFSFSNLAYGSYQVYVEDLNRADVPDTFTLSGQNPGVTGIVITVNSNSAVATAITNLNSINVSGVFPNPVSTLLDVEISSKLPANATLTLNDVLGQNVASQSLHLVSGLNKSELNMEGLASGVYEIVVQSDNQRLTYKVVKTN